MHCLTPTPCRRATYARQSLSPPPDSRRVGHQNTSNRIHKLEQEREEALQTVAALEVRASTKRMDEEVWYWGALCVAMQARLGDPVSLVSARVVPYPCCRVVCDG